VEVIDFKLVTYED